MCLEIIACLHPYYYSAVDGSGKPAGANAAAQGAAGLRAQRHRCDYVMRA
jgi:hypothetical protein